MKSIKSLYIILFFLSINLFYSQTALAQRSNIIKELPYSSDEYFTQLSIHFDRVQDKKKKIVKKFLKDLEEKWTTGFFSDDIKEKIYETSNLMLQNKMRAMPFFYDYLNTLELLIESDLPEDTKNSWMKSLDLVLKTQKNSVFTEYLDNSNKLFNENYIFNNRIITWKVTGNWSMEVDSSIRYIFPKTDLICYTKGDSSKIYATSGVYLPLAKKWTGNGGVVNWERANFDPNEVYANIKHYQIQMKMSKYRADSVAFFNYRYFDKPLLGVLEEQVLASRHGKKALYPAFTSYNKQWKIPEIFKDIDFSGGFKIEGAKLIGIGDSQDPVTLVFKRKGKRFITLKSNSFSIETDRIRSQYASITIHYLHDSIYHSGLRMNYSDAKRELSLIRDERGLRADPFFDTFHQLDMFVEAAYWNMDEDVMDFDMIKGMNKRPALFESNNRYSLQHFDKLQGYDAKHPLSMLNKYTRENMSDVVYIIDYAKYMGMPYEQVKLQLLGLAHEGFVIYNSDEDKVTVTDRTKFYLNARGGQVDYDVILFKSDSTKLTNAELKLDSFDLRINGVQRIILSDSQNLIIEPGDKAIADDDYIVVGKNRNFRFNGKITAGRFSFKAYGCTFDYNAFKLYLPQIDSLWFWVEGEPLPMGGREHKAVQTALINLSGDILIDHPSNKSGLKPYPDYPVFNSKKDSYAYYDKPSIEKGVYTRDRFYYRISPFVLTSLDNIKTEDIRFDGYLYSGGIFPDIAEPLRVMDDYSLGFKKQTPASGLVAYGDKGTFYNTVNLSNRGLRGDGTLSYLKSTTLADNYIFYLDSMNVHSNEFNIAATTGAVEYPRVSGKEVYQHWMPYQDNMEIYSEENFISMYDEETAMEGMLSLKPSGLSGDGHLHYKVAVMSSKLYDFNNMTYEADTVNFVDDGWKLSDFKATADYNERKILFTSNSGMSVVEFTDNLYICYMDEATWFMDKDETSYSKKDATLPAELVGKSKKELVDMEIQGSEFYSIHPNQDSLTFKSSMATFNSRRKVIKAEGVIKIDVADAAIFPGDHLVTILKDANMLPLKNAAVLANTTTKYHEIEDAEIKINGKKDYRGSGNYQYVDMDKKHENIYFSDIRVDTTLQTIASGTILKENDFSLSPAFAFYGDAHLLASRKTLEFDGGFKIKTGCINGDNWIAFNSIVDPENVMIPIPAQPRVPDISKTRKYAGIANSPTNREIYSVFFQDKQDYFDSVLISANGYIAYNYPTAEYRISTEEKLSQLNRPDDYLSYNANTCKTHAEGQVNFDIRTGDVKLKSFGQVDEKSGDAEFDVATAFDFYFSTKALDEIVTVFKNNDYTPYDMTSDYYQKVAGGFMGIQAADKYISKIMTGSQRRVPESLQHTIMINEMKMKWQPATNSYISQGKIVLGGFLKTRINGEVDGYVEYKKVRSGDVLNIYFEIGGEWFYFNYHLNVMQVLSSMSKFNDIIQEDVTGKGKKNRLKEGREGGKKSTYRYIKSTTKKKDDFLTRIKPYI
jgi:hypothetical protein